LDVEEPFLSQSDGAEATMSEKKEQATLDLSQGIAASEVRDGGLILGRVGDEEVVLARSGTELFAIRAHCSHYRGPLVDGLIVGDTVRCPWHHACFNLRTGEALRAPALDPIACWRVERDGDRIVVREKLPPAGLSPASTSDRQAPSSIVIVGGGAAGVAAAEMLRRKGYDGPVTMISADADPPVDRPNLSKDFLAGEAQDDWIPLWPNDFYAEQRIELVLGRRVVSIDPAKRSVRLDDGSDRGYGALLLATGADAVRLPIPGAQDDQVRYLRSFADSRAIVERATKAKRVVVVGASFIGLEVAASLRARGIAVDIVAPDSTPLERVMGVEVGRFVRSLHEAHGVSFHLGQTVARVDGRTLTLSGGATLDCDFMVLGVGVRPALAIAEQAGLAIDRGISVNEYLETSAPGIFAAGDAARWPDPHTGERIRVEHWVVAERMGQVAARNMLGRRERFDTVPFFWSQHYDVAINYVGYAERWDEVRIDGSLDAQDCLVEYRNGGRTLAVATVGRDRASLEAEARMERNP
jgi:NADPH-dependent 2,4-dienoyl-CoA reductase/sulfur reductase-like enzyme/nitrite reductase/ring-hydroxylating ferredoxin subunit